MARPYAWNRKDTDMDSPDKIMMNLYQSWIRNDNVPFWSLSDQHVPTIYLLSDFCLPFAPVIPFPLFFDISTSVVENVVMRCVALRCVALRCVVLRCVWIPFPIAVFLIPDSTAYEMPQEIYSLFSLILVVYIRCPRYPYSQYSSFVRCAVLCCAVILQPFRHVHIDSTATWYPCTWALIIFSPLLWAIEERKEVEYITRLCRCLLLWHATWVPSFLFPFDDWMGQTDGYRLGAARTRISVRVARDRLAGPIPKSSSSSSSSSWRPCVTTETRTRTRIKPPTTPLLLLLLALLSTASASFPFCCFLSICCIFVILCCLSFETNVFCFPSKANTRNTSIRMDDW